MRVSTSRRYSCGSMPRRRQLSIIVYITALCCPASAFPKKPALLADSCRLNRIFHAIVVDFDAAVGDILGEKLPVREGVADGFSKCARWEMPLGGLHFFKRPLEAAQYHRALTGSHDRSQCRPSLAFAQACFDAVEILDLIKDPVGTQWHMLPGFMEVAQRMGPATGQFDALAFAGESRILGRASPLRAGPTRKIV